MADVIFCSSHLSSSSLLTILPSPSQSSTSLSPIHRKPFKKNCIYGARDTSSPDFMSGRRLRSSFKINAAKAETEQPKWWEKNAGPNMIDIHSTQEFLNSLSVAGEKLVIVEFYGTWCASCRALFPKLCRTAEEHPEILFLKVNFDANKRMCKSLNVKVLIFISTAELMVNSSPSHVPSPSSRK